MTDREQKIIDNMNLVHYIVHKHFPQYITNQDVIQNGYVGLIKAVDSFDESMGNTFATYAARCIFNEIAIHGLVCCFCGLERYKCLHALTDMEKVERGKKWMEESKNAEN